MKGCLVRKQVLAAHDLRHGALSKCLTLQVPCSGHFKKVSEIPTSALQTPAEYNPEEQLKTFICSHRLFWYSNIQHLGSRVNPKLALYSEASTAGKLRHRCTGHQNRNNSASSQRQLKSREFRNLITHVGIQPRC